MNRLVMVLALISYFVSGIGLTCFNKWLLGTHFYNFGFPITLILCHMISNFLLSGLTIGLFLSPQLRSSSFYPTHLSYSLFLRRFVPIGILFAADITLTNISFRYVPVALTEVIKGLVPAGIMLIEMSRSEGSPSIPKAGVIVLLTVGVVLTSMGEMEFNWSGALAAIGALVAAIAKFVLLEKLLMEEEEGGGKGRGEGAGKGVMERAASREMEMVGVSKTAKEEIGKGRGGDYQQVSEVEMEDEEKDGNTVDRPITIVQVEKQEEMKEQQGEAMFVAGDLEGNEETKLGVKEVKLSPSSASSSSSLRRRSPPPPPPSNVGDVNLPVLTLPRSVSSNDPPSSSSSVTPLPDMLPLHRPSSSIPLASNTEPAIPLSLPAPSPSTQGGHRRLHPILSLFYFSPVAAFVLFPTFLSRESRLLFHPLPSSPSFTSSTDTIVQTSLLIVFGAVLAFALNISELFVIQATSALTLCVVATAKFLLVVGLTTVVFGEDFSWINGIGCGVSVVGVGAYNYYKYLEAIKVQEEVKGSEGDMGMNEMGGKIKRGMRKGRQKVKRMMMGRVRKSTDNVDVSEIEDLVDRRVSNG